MITLPCIAVEEVQDISGAWLFNKELSDDFLTTIKEHVNSARNNRGRPDGYTGATRGGSDSDPGGPPSGSSIRPSGAGRPSAADRGSYRKAMQNELGSIMLFSDKIQIFQNDPEIIFNLSATKQRIIYTDGRGFTISSSDIAPNQIGPYIAAWNKDKQLVIETTTSKGITLEELFILSQDGKRLHTRISIKLPSIDEPIIVNRFYDLNRQDMTE
jgi:hypothetical protein